MDTTKSDDRYAYESKLWDQVAENLIELGLDEGQLKKELKDLKKASETGKGKYVAKADKVES